jgi:signal transduction histidine kinase
MINQVILLEGKQGLSSFNFPYKPKISIPLKIEISKPKAITKADDVEFLKNEIQTLKKEKQVLEKKLIFTETLAGFIAHEMRTPLATLNLCLDIIAGNKNIIDQGTRQIIANGKQTVKQTDNFIDMLLLKLRKMSTEIQKKDLKQCFILDDVEDALRSYPFTENERKQVTWDKKSAFTYLGDSILTKHIIFNLLKNAFKIIYEEGKGKITISFKQTQENNQLIFTDTAKGISKDLLPTIFDIFVTQDKTHKGAGLGLAFCKIVMQGYGGDITCKSRLGKYTRFILSFPKEVSNEYV